MICNKCGNTLPDDSEFCQYCGRRIERENVDSQAIPDTRTVKVKVKVKKHHQVTPAIEEGNHAISTPSKELPKNVQFCSRCGSMIDTTSKKCTGCGKQYFKVKKLLMILISVALCISLLSLGCYLVVMSQIANNKRRTALEAIDQKNYAVAYDIVAELDTSPNIQKHVQEALYLAGRNHYNNGQYEISNDIFTVLGDYKDSSQLINYKVLTVLYTDSDKVTIKDLKNNPQKYDGKQVKLQAVVWNVGDFFYVVDKEYYDIYPNALISPRDFEETRHVYVIRGYECEESPDNLKAGDEVVVIGQFVYQAAGEEYLGVKDGRVTTLIRAENYAEIRAKIVYYP